MAAEMAEMEDIQVEMAFASDDVASAPKEEKEKRRGIAGEFFVYKMAGAAANQGFNLSDVARIARKTNENTCSKGVGLTPCSLPQTGEPSFEIGDNEMEIGLGHHGEPGIEKAPLESADNVADQLLKAIFNDMQLNKGEEGWRPPKVRVFSLCS